MGGADKVPISVLCKASIRDSTVRPPQWESPPRQARVEEPGIKPTPCLHDICTLIHLIAPCTLLSCPVIGGASMWAGIRREACPAAAGEVRVGQQPVLRQVVTRPTSLSRNSGTFRGRNNCVLEIRKQAEEGASCGCDGMVIEGAAV